MRGLLDHCGNEILAWFGSSSGSSNVHRSADTRPGHYSRGDPKSRIQQILMVWVVASTRVESVWIIAFRDAKHLSWVKAAMVGSSEIGRGTRVLIPRYQHQKLPHIVAVIYDDHRPVFLFRRSTSTSSTLIRPKKQVSSTMPSKNSVVINTVAIAGVNISYIPRGLMCNR